jgi:shikimate kinase
MSKQQNIFLIGPMGAGKTSIGRQIAKELHRDFYDSDEIIEQRTGADIPWIFDIEGEEGFRRRETEVITELTQLQGIVLATGGGVIAITKNRTALAANGIVIYLQASLEEQLQRTRQSKRRPLSREEEIRKVALQKLQIEHSPLYEDASDLIYNSNLRSVRAVALDIIKQLQAKNYL